MTNPNSAVGTNGAFGGRTSVNAFNDVMGAFKNRGLLSGWGIVPSSGMTVNVGGSGTVRDVAVAEDNSGNKTSVNNISGAPISITLDSAPASNSRYDAIVAYVDKPPTGSGTQDNPECCGIIPVTGTAASTPSYPSDGDIRSAITADGASGSTAYYVVLGYVLVASGTTTITSGMITAGSSAAITSDKIDWTTMKDSSTERIVGQTSDGRDIYEQTVSGTVTYTANTRVTVATITPGNNAKIISVDGYVSIPVSESTIFYISPDVTYYSSTGEAVAKVWSYHPTDNRIMTSAWANNAGSGEYYIRYRYTKS